MIGPADPADPTDPADRADRAGSVDPTRSGPLSDG